MYSKESNKGYDKRIEVKGDFIYTIFTRNTKADVFHPDFLCYVEYNGEIKEGYDLYNKGLFIKDNEQKFAASTIGDFYKCILYIGNLNQDTDFKIIMGIMDESARKKYNEAEEKAMNKSSSELPNQEDYVNSKSEVFIKIDKNNLEE